MTSLSVILCSITASAFVTTSRFTTI